MRWLARGAVGFLLMGSLTAGAAWSITPHHAPAKTCAVTLYVDGHWTPAPTSDQDALHYSCGETP